MIIVVRFCRKVLLKERLPWQKVNNEYNDSSIQVLEGLEAVRKDQGCTLDPLTAEACII